MLARAVQQAQQEVHETLLDNINTAAALDALSSLIKATNQYLAAKQAAATANASSQAAAGDDAATAAGLAAAGPQPLLLRKAAAFVTRILSVFGLLPVREACLFTLSPAAACSVLSLSGLVKHNQVAARLYAPAYLARHDAGNVHTHPWC